MNLIWPELAVTYHQRELAGEAARRRLVAQATCCRPSAVERAVARLGGVWARVTDTPSTTCCAAA